MRMNINYYMKLQNAYKTTNNREKNLAKVNRAADKHFDDTFDTHDVLVNDKPMQLMIIKDTDGNVNKKKIKSRHSDKFNIGDYVIWNGQTWLVTLVDTDDKTWNRGYMYLCTLLLRWQDSDGSIIERWVYSEDYTKYSMGETGNNNITIGDYQYGLTIPVDEYTKKLKRGNRFVIDFEGNYPPDTYRLSGKKAYLNDDSYFNRGRVMTITLSYDFFNKEKDKLLELENEKKVWICDYHSPTDIPVQPENPDSPQVVSATISGTANLRIGFYRTYSVSFSDNFGNTINPDFTWNIVSDFPIKSEVVDKKIKLLVEDEDYISSSFLLQAIIEDTVVEEIEITVVEGF